MLMLLEGVLVEGRGFVIRVEGVALGRCFIVSVVVEGAMLGLGAVVRVKGVV